MMATYFIEPTSTTLLQAVSAGDREALHRVFSIYHPLVYSWCRKLGAQPADAEDAAQVVFQNIRDRIQSYERRRSPFRTWLWRVAANTTADVKKESRILYSNDVVEQFEAPASATSSVPPRMVVVRMIEVLRNCLSETDYEILSASESFGRPMPEIAKELGISIGAAHVRKSRARKRLRTQLEGLEDEWADSCKIDSYRE